MNRFLRARLQNFDVAHIFGLYDFLGPAVAAECRRLSVPYVVEPIGMFLPIVRNVRLKRMYHGIWGRKMLRGARFLIATSDQEVDELASAGLPRDRIVLRRNGVDQVPAVGQHGRFAFGIEFRRMRNWFFFSGVYRRRRALIYCWKRSRNCRPSLRAAVRSWRSWVPTKAE